MYFTTDTISNAITATDNGDGDTLSLDAVSTTIVENAPFERAFDTKKFYTFDVVVARPIEQQYIHDGEVRTFKKPSWALKKAAWSLDNVPYPLTHPKTKIVTDIAQIHGFHRRPRYEEDYDEKGDALLTRLYVPTTDSEATDFLSTNPSVSVGVFNDLDWETDESSVDAYQTNLYFDHVAGVEQGRCSLEDGCGIVTDSSIDVMDGVAVLPTTDESYSVGDTVRWSWSDGTAHGRIDTVVTKAGTEISAEGATRVAKEDRPAYKIEVYREDEQEYSGYAVKLHGENNLSKWKGPSADSCDGVCRCGCHVSIDEKSVSDIDLVPPQAAQNAAQRVLDARSDDEKDVSGMRDHGWSRAKQLANGSELSPSDIVSGSGAMAPWWSRHATYSISGSDGSYSLKRDESIDDWWKDNSYVAGLGWGGVSGYKWTIRKGNEIKRAREEEANYSLDAWKTKVGVSFEGTRDGKLDESDIPSDDFESHYLYDGETKSESSYPVVDADGYLRKGNVESAWKLGARGGIDSDTHDENLRTLAREFDDLTLSSDSFETITTNTNMTDTDTDGQELNLDSMVGGLTVDAIAEKNEHVEELVEDAESSKDRVDILEDKVETLEASLDEAEDKLTEFEEGEREPKSAIVDSITDLTGAWDEDELMDCDYDELERRKQLAEDAATSPSTPTDDEGEKETTTDSEGSKTSTGDVDFDKHRSWR